MNLRKKLFDLSLESKGLYYRLPIIFALFFFVPLLGLLYFGLSYDFLGKSDVPVFILVLLGSSLAGYVMMRRVFDDILSTSARISKSLPQNLEGPGKAETSNELRGIVQSFQAVENELRNNFTNLEKRASQLSTLKELSDLCYVTFDSDDLFAITMERAMKLTGADVGSILILEG
ncbi:MAG: hypothetical protein KKI04_06470, partial [Proteobacteria bacterium]|nr:hypothetical protein [Pseudomonadota bacterium]